MGSALAGAIAGAEALWVGGGAEFSVVGGTGCSFDGGAGWAGCVAAVEAGVATVVVGIEASTAFCLCER